MQPDQLRRVAALVHTVPGAEVTLRSVGGASVVVGRRPGADLTPCQFRLAAMAIATSSRHGAAGEAGRIVSAELGGSLSDVGADIARSRTPCGIEQRWLTTTLPCPALHDVLDDAGPDGLPHDSMAAQARVDAELGVITIAIAVADRRHHASLDAVALDAAARCFAEELVRQTADRAPTTALAETGTPHLVDDPRPPAAEPTRPHRPNESREGHR